MHNQYKKIFIAIIFLVSGFSHAHSLSIKYNKNISNSDKLVLEKTFEEVSQKLPSKMIEGLPTNIEISVEKLSNHTNIPNDICSSNESSKDKNKFVYGEYSNLSNTLKLNIALINEFKNGREKSFKINCQHKNLYDQALATIIHELGHAYDHKQDNISSSFEFLRRAGFKNGLLKIKNKNTQAMRSADTYELKNVAEAFSVNLEYFVLDEEFACRRPSMFEFFKSQFNQDMYPNKNCILNKNVMMTTPAGFYPINLDPKRVYRIDYLMASAGNDLSSGFGHSMFRLIVCAPDRFDPITRKTIVATPYGPKCLNDKLYHVVVSYRANVEDATLNYLKGVFGGYPSMLFILNYGDVLDEYNRDELRDVLSYPLKLSDKEKDDVVIKIIEEHWNYRGAYKFVTNNCAVESIDLLKASLDRSQLNKNSPLTPNGLLSDLDKIEILDRKSSEVEISKARTDQLFDAMKNAYGYKSKSIKENKKTVLKFVDESSFEFRIMSFNGFVNRPLSGSDGHEKLFALKEKLIKASSFSVLEQQILRSFGSKMKKKVADLYFNTKDAELKKKIDSITNGLRSNFSDMSNAGYGVPLLNEMTTLDKIIEKSDSNSKKVQELDELFSVIMASDYETIKQISNNILVMNDFSIKSRFLYRDNLEQYINEVLSNMRKSDLEFQILLKVQENDQSAINELRVKLDPKLISKTEILDSKLVKMVNKILQ